MTTHTTDYSSSAEVQRLLRAAGLTQAQAAERLTEAMGKPYEHYHVSRMVNGQRRVTAAEMDALRKMADGVAQSEGSGARSEVYLGERVSKPTTLAERVNLFRGAPLGSRSFRLSNEFLAGDAPVHPAQRGHKDAFAFIVQSDRNADRLMQGDVAYAVRHLPPRGGQPCLVETKDSEVTVTIYDRHDDKTLFGRQLRPPKIETWPLSEVAGLHAIVGVGIGGAI